MVHANLKRYIPGDIAKIGDLQYEEILSGVMLHI